MIENYKYGIRNNPLKIAISVLINPFFTNWGKTVTELILPPYRAVSPGRVHSNFSTHNQVNIKLETIDKINHS